MKKLILINLFICIIALTGFAQVSVMDFYDARVKAHKEELKKIDADVANAPFTIKTKDIKNGFISYDLPLVEGYEEMAYYIPAKGNKFVAVAQFGCGPICEAGLPKFYQLIGGKLIEKTDDYLSEAQRTQIDKGMEVAKGKIKITDSETSLSSWTKVPQQGTTIQIGYMEDGGAGDDKFHIIYELVYIKATGTFNVVKK